jgi:hypothetical protein
MGTELIQPAPFLPRRPRGTAATPPSCNTTSRPAIACPNIQAQQAGQANLDIFAEGSVIKAGAQTLFTMPESPIKTLAELRGKTVAINAAVMPEPCASVAEQQDGLQRVVDVMLQFIGFDPSFKISTMLMSGR